MSVAKNSLLGACSLLLLLVIPTGAAAPVSPVTRDRLDRGLPTWVVVEYDRTQVDRVARDERLRRGLAIEDDAILAQRQRDYRRLKAPLEASLRGVDTTGVIDYDSLPLAAWRLTSAAALARLQAAPGIVRVHENAALHAVSVSDLAFIGQPAAAAAGATGSGTTVAVIDGGLGSAYLNYADFGPCTGVGAPAATCRVVVNREYYTGANASVETAHGTNVAAIALGVAPGAKLANYNVFHYDPVAKASGASVADILDAMNRAIARRSTYNIVAINLSLGDGSSNTTPCPLSAFASAVSSALGYGILTVVAAGNSSSKLGLAEPACVPGVVSVGAVYDAAYGSQGWVTPAGNCYDNSAADRVACFSQSSDYLSLLAPGSHVSAPDAGFQLTGTSQATPHVTGAIAALRARYPAESAMSTLQRLQSAGVPVRDPDPAANGRVTPRLNLSASVLLGTALGISGSGPATATAGGTSTYVVSVANSGPLVATAVTVTATVPAGASYVSGSPGCSLAGGRITCSAASLNVNATTSFTIQLRWNATGPVYFVASVTADQVNSAPGSRQAVGIGTAPATGEGGDAPLPDWTWILLAGALMLLIAWRGAQPGVRA